MNKLEEILEPITLSYWDSHQFENALHEEGEYVKLEDAKLVMKEYAEQECIGFAEWLLKRYTKLFPSGLDKIFQLYIKSKENQ